MNLRVYDDLRARIRLMSKSESDYEHLCSLILRHFEGVYVRDLMPDELWNILYDWEMEQRES